MEPGADPPGSRGRLQGREQCKNADMDDAGFWAIIDRLDWSRTGDDERVVEPAVRALAEMTLADIQSFQDIMAAKLHALDGRKWAREAGPGIWWSEGPTPCCSADGFLYARCVVVANGPTFFDKVLADPTAMPKDMEFESLLYIARSAEERKTGASDGLDSPVSFETFSNEGGWR
jgi:hypothetical protein